MVRERVAQDWVDVRFISTSKWLVGAGRHELRRNDGLHEHAWAAGIAKQRRRRVAGKLESMSYHFPMVNEGSTCFSIA